MVIDAEFHEPLIVPTVIFNIRHAACLTVHAGAVTTKNFNVVTGLGAQAKANEGLHAKNAKFFGIAAITVDDGLDFTAGNTTDTHGIPGIGVPAIEASNITNRDSDIATVTIVHQATLSP